MPFLCSCFAFARLSKAEIWHFDTFRFFKYRIDGLSRNHFQEFRKNNIPVVEDLLTLKIPLCDMEIVSENTLIVALTKCYKKSAKGLLRYNNNICCVSLFRTVFPSFGFPNLDAFSTKHSIWSKIVYIPWATEKNLSQDIPGYQKNCIKSLPKSVPLWFQVHKSSKTLRKNSKIPLWIKFCPLRDNPRYTNSHLGRELCPNSSVHLFKLCGGTK